MAVRLVKNIVLQANRNMFCAELNAARLGDMRLVLFENSSMSIVHDEHHARLADGDEIFVCRQMAGALQLEQLNRELVLQPGDITFLDPTLPYRGRFFSGSRLLVLKVPRRTLDRRDVPLRDLWCSPVTRGDPHHRLTSEVLGILPNHLLRRWFETMSWTCWRCRLPMSGGDMLRAPSKCEGQQRPGH